MRYIIIILTLLFAFVNSQSWLDPAIFPNSTKCDTNGTGMYEKYQQCFRGTPVPVYNIRTTPVIAMTNPVRYKSPIIDGFLENEIWSYAETLLVNSWEDAGQENACKDNKKFSGSTDLHAIWRFCYNHFGLYVSCEVHDDVLDV
ncbi:MAG: hypothetical protein JNL74_20865, partial [Fibrobacteres bacterium]|nr:hypothetical protein [Fibrobacterota bacterium]